MIPRLRHRLRRFPLIAILVVGGLLVAAAPAGAAGHKPPHEHVPHEHASHSVLTPGQPVYPAALLRSFTKAFAEHPSLVAASPDASVPSPRLSVRPPPKDYLSEILVVLAIVLVVIGYIFFVIRRRTRRIRL